MYIEYMDYLELGYTLVSDEQFDRYERMACKAVEKETFERVDSTNITDDNKRGICELIDLYYNESNQLNKPVVSFSNNGYSETYGNSNQRAIANKVSDIIKLYFTYEQLYRGVDI